MQIVRPNEWNLRWQQLHMPRTKLCQKMTCQTSLKKDVSLKTLKRKKSHVNIKMKILYLIFRIGKINV
ncbi:hypothetical protein X975_14862, partial [Stegodyphus mimosarum]